MELGTGAAPIRPTFDDETVEKPATLDARVPVLTDGELQVLSPPRGMSTAPEKEGDMAALPDILYIGIALGFLAISWGLVELCDRL